MKFLLVLLLLYLEMGLTVTQELWWDNTQPNAERKERISNLQFQEDQGDQCHLFHPTNEVKSIFYTVHWYTSKLLQIFLNTVTAQAMQLLLRQNWNQWQQIFKLL